MSTLRMARDIAALQEELAEVKERLAVLEEQIPKKRGPGRPKKNDEQEAAVVNG